MKKSGFAHLMSSISFDPGVMLFIHDDDVQQSEGCQGVSKQPIMSTTIMHGLPCTPRSSSGGARVVHREPVPMEDLHGLPSPGVSLFVPGWNIHTSSRLYVCSNALEFALHARPPATAGDMDAMGNSHFSHIMAYATVQAMCYLVASSW